MARPQPGVLEAIPAEESCGRRTEPGAAEAPRPEEKTLQSCKQHLSFGPKVFRCKGLAHRHQRGTSCKQQLSPRTGLCNSSTSPSPGPAGVIFANNILLAQPPILPHK